MSGRGGYEIDGVRVAQARMALNQDADPRQDDERPMTQGELGELIGRNRVTVNKIEAGAARVSLETLERLSAALGRSREYLLGEPENVDPIEAAREMMANATAKLTSGMEDFTSALALLEERARTAGRQTDDVQA